MSSHSKSFSAALLVAGTLGCLLFFFFSEERPAGSATSENSARSDAPSEPPEFPGKTSRANQPAAPFPASPVPAIPAANLESLDAFLSWIDDHRALPASDRPSILDRGLALAGARRPLIRQLIHENPEVALAHSLTLDQYHALPAEVRALVEKPFSALAGIDVFPRCDSASATRQSDLKTSQHVDLHLTLNSESPEANGDILDAFTWGWRLEAPSRSAAPVQGIQLDGLAAFREAVFQPLRDSEIPVAENLFPVANPSIERGFASGRPLSEKPVVALAAGWLFYFADRPAFETFQEKAASLETRLGPENGSGLIFENLAATIAGPEDDPGGYDFEKTEALAEKIENLKIAGNRKVLMIRVDFSDKTGSPIGTSTLQNRMDGEVDDQCRDMSFNRLHLTTTVESTLVRMPRPSTYYNGTDDGSKKNSALYNDALSAAAAAGINTSGYNHRCIVFKSIGMGYCGLATVGGGKIWLPCHGSKVIVHELGHNFGVTHASFHDPNNDNDPLGAGSSSEYGDNTDIMGGGGVPGGHFHPQAKTRLAWLDGNQRHNFNSGNTNNTYRIYRFDDPGTDAANARRAIRVYRGTNNEYLWIGYRQRYGGSSYQNYLKGAQVHWQKAGKSKSWLLDLTPGGGKNNSGLGIGRTFSDTRKDIHITTLKRGGSNPNQWLEVQVTRGPFAGNRAPSITSIDLPNRVPVNEPFVVTAAATDPDGDSLAYSFDFKDGKVTGNDGTASNRTYTWTSTGSKTVTVTVSDRRGKTASLNATVTVQNRLNPPANFSASDSPPSDRIQLTWNAVSGASSYAIYRSLTNAEETASQIGTASTPSFSDTGAAVATTYYYWVQALGSGAISLLSNADAGFRDYPAPDAPAGLSATYNVHTDRIELTWRPEALADLYEIHRGTSPDKNQAVAIGESASAAFTDRTAQPGTYFFFWVRGKNENGFGEFSAPTGGSRRLGQPENVQASQGGDNREVVITWSAVDGAASYAVYRSDSPGANSVLVGSTSELSLADLPPDELRLYEYTVKAKNGGGSFGDASSPAGGFRTFPPPENVTATDGIYDDRVRVSWTAADAPGAVRYEVFRSDHPSGDDPTSLGMTSGTRFDDRGTAPDQDFHYRVRAILGTAIITQGTQETIRPDLASPLSLADPGHRSSEIQFRPDALIGKRPNSLLGNNVRNLSGAGQQLRKVSKGARKVNGYLGIQHDGKASLGRIRVAGPRSNRFFGIKYRDLSRGGANVTAQVAQALYVARLDAGTARTLKIEIKPTRLTRGKKKRKRLSIMVSSTEVSGRRDVVGVLVRTR